MITRFTRLLWSQKMIPLYDQLVVSGSSFITIVLVGRSLSQEDFGLFSLGMMSMLFLANLHRAVFTQPLNVIGATDDEAHLAGRLLALLQGHWFAIPLSTAALALASWFLYPQFTLLLGVALYVGCYFLQEMLRRYWYTQGKAREALVNDVISYGGQLFLLVIWTNVWPLTGAVAFSLMASTSLVAFGIGLRRLDLPSQVIKPTQRSVFLSQWDMTRWLILTVLAVWGAGQVYPFLIAPLGPVVVASFTACRSLLNVMGVLVQSVGNVLPARAAALLKHSGKMALRKHMLQTLAQFLLVALLFLLAIHFFSADFLHLVYNGRYDSAAPLLRILAWGTAATLIATLMGSYALAMGDSRSGFIANLGATCVTLTLGLYLIRSHGVLGAAMATAASLAAAMLLQTALAAYRYNQIPTKVASHA